jgi:hypothetical protein
MCVILLLTICVCVRMAQRSQVCVRMFVCVCVCVCVTHLKSNDAVLMLHSLPYTYVCVTHMCKYPPPHHMWVINLDSNDAV